MDLKKEVEIIRRDYEGSRERLKESFDARIREFYNILEANSAQFQSLEQEVAQSRANKMLVEQLHQENMELQAQIDKLQNERNFGHAQQVGDEQEVWEQIQKQWNGNEVMDNARLYGEVLIYHHILENIAPEFFDDIRDRLPVTPTFVRPLLDLDKILAETATEPADYQPLSITATSRTSQEVDDIFDELIESQKKIRKIASYMAINRIEAENEENEEFDGLAVENAPEMTENPKNNDELVIATNNEDNLSLSSGFQSIS